MLRAENLGAVILNSQPNFAWATAGANNGIDTSRENGAASIVIRADGKRFLLANCIEMPRMLDEEVSGEDFELIEYGWTEEKARPDFVAQRAASLLENSQPLASDMPFGANVSTIESLIARCRFELTSWEIERYKQLGKDAGARLGELMRRVQPGETEIAVATRARQALAIDNIHAVVCLVAADERLCKYRHPVPTEKVWQKTLMVVVCARRDGLIASLSRIVCAGQIPTELAGKTEACARVSAALHAATTPGATGAELYKIAADAYARENFAREINLHHQGGATGYRTRDWTAHPASGDTVFANQAFAWNPSISGTKTEETCIVSENGIEIITTSPDWTQIKTEINGREYSSPGVLSL